MDRSQGHDPGPRPMARIADGSQGHGPGPGSRARLRAKARAGARGQGHDPGPRPMARIAYGSQGQGPGQDQGQDPGPRPGPRARARGKGQGQDPGPGSPAATSANRGLSHQANAARLRSAAYPTNAIQYYCGRRALKVHPSVAPFICTPPVVYASNGLETPKGRK
jgi:hypothetical protein